jgi:DNA-binding NarL/FixJ family response regulator
MPAGVPREDAVSSPPGASVPHQSDRSARVEGPKGGLTLLVIEDSRTGERSVPEMLDAAGGYVPGDALSGASGERIRVRTARNLTEAGRLLTDDVQCILLDLALTHHQRPERSSADAETDELEMLRQVLRLAPRHAVLALTDGADAQRASEAVRVGAQDYLFRDELDGRLLNRAIRYAVERKRADLAQRQLTESRLRAQENARLERGLLPPRPLTRAARRRLLRHSAYGRRHRPRDDRRRVRPRPGRSGARRGTAHRLAGVDLRGPVR